MSNYTTKKELQEIINRAENLYNLVYGNDYDFSGCKTNTDKYSRVSSIILSAMEKEIEENTTESQIENNIKIEKESSLEEIETIIEKTENAAQKEGTDTTKNYRLYAHKTNALYKIYKNNELIDTEESLTGLREILNLPKADTKKCFYPGVHKIKGFKVITYVD